MRRLASVFFGGDGGGSTVADLGLLLLRVVAGLMLAFAHGVNKLPPSERFLASVDRLGFPLPEVFAWAAGLAEFIGGILLALGLLTRPSAFFIACTMATAAFLRHAADPFTDKEKALLFLVIALFFLIAGSGRFGLDEWFRRRERQYVRRY
ncbi:MAG TPA: DoxX family protein [Rubricoccaceae bacterium]|nr:DoxX family protein [Rubricoccaceae bacterium]